MVYTSQCVLLSKKKKPINTFTTRKMVAVYLFGRKLINEKAATVKNRYYLLSLMARY